MKIYTSYYAQVKNLEAEDIVPVSISRGKPEWFRGPSFDGLAPTWEMLKMSDEDYDREYQRILAGLNPHKFVAILEDRCQGRDAALLCFEKDVRDCHRNDVARWLRENGYECEEFVPRSKRMKQPSANPESAPLTLF